MKSVSVRNLITGSMIAICMGFSGCATAPDATGKPLSANTEILGQQNHIGSQPNVIVILTDDQGYADVGFNGSTDIPTPNIDRIAYEGARFDRGYVSFPVCGPSRAGLLTGRYQSRFGFDLNPSENPDDPNAGLPLSEHTIGDVMARAGYRSSVIGKWHMGNHPKFHPLERGFDEFFGFTNGGHNFYADEYRDIDVTKVSSSAALYQTRLVRNRESIDTSGYLTDLLSDEAVDFIERSKDEPFVLYLAYNAPHVPLQAPPRYTDRFPHIEDEKRKIYAGMIAAVDDGVGRVLDKLDELDIADDTIVFFLSDNGGPLRRARNGAINLPYRGGKGDIYEGGVRVPFAARWPAAIPAGIDYPHPVSSLDILATAASAAGVSAVKNPLDGVDLIPFLKDTDFESKPHDALFWRYRDNDKDIEKFDYVGMVRDDNKFVRRNKNFQLYDLSIDQAEQVNLRRTNPEKTEDMVEDWTEWHSEMGELSISIWNEWPVKKNNQSGN